MVFNRNRAYWENIARAFEERDVARCYLYRPDYPEALHEKLLTSVKNRNRALDIGCGPGKITSKLADFFDEVVAIDPSNAMIDTGVEIDGGRHSNLKWERTRAEDYNDNGTFSIVTAGSSIHWLDHEIVFPKLAKWTKLVAVISGDGPDYPPCGKEPWHEFISRWLSVLVKMDPSRWQVYDPTSFTAEANRHEMWIDIAGREQFRHLFAQRISDFIESQHSQASWSRSAMGPELSGRFDREITELLSPYSEEVILTLDIVSTLTWGRPRSYPRKIKLT